MTSSFAQRDLRFDDEMTGTATGRKVKKSWDEPDASPQEEGKSEPPKYVGKPGKARLQKIAEREAKERKVAEQKMAEELKANPKLLEEKRKMEEKKSREDDARNFCDLLSGFVDEKKITTRSSSSTLDFVSAEGSPLDTETEWKNFTEMVVKKTCSSSNRGQLVKFLTALLRKGTETMNMEQVMQLRMTIMSIHQEKLKMEEADKKKKKSNGRSSLNVSRASSTSVSENTLVGEGSDFDFV